MDKLMELLGRNHIAAAAARTATREELEEALLELAGTQADLEEAVVELAELLGGEN